MKSETPNIGAWRAKGTSFIADGNTKWYISYEFGKFL